MAKTFYILTIFTLGIFLTPGEAYACGGHCKKETKQQTTKQGSSEKACCKNKQNSSKHKDCKGNCGDSSCHCTHFQVTFFLPLIVEIKYQNDFISSKKQQFYDKEIHLSSGFYSIWTPPNIG